MAKKDAPSRLAQLWTLAWRRDVVWSSSKRWTLALVISVFPFIFMLDDVVTWSVSPVVPGLVLLVVLVMGLPFLLDRLARPRVDTSTEKIGYRRFSKLAATCAWAWFGGWFLFLV